MAAHVMHVAVKLFFHFGFHMRDFLGALEVARVHHTHLDEDEVPECPPEQADDAEKRVQPQTVVSVHEQDRGLVPGVVFHPAWFHGEVSELKGQEASATSTSSSSRFSTLNVFR